MKIQTRFIGLWMTLEQYEQCTVAAKAAQLTLSEWLREAANGKLMLRPTREQAIVMAKQRLHAAKARVALLEEALRTGNIEEGAIDLAD